MYLSDHLASPILGLGGTPHSPPPPGHSAPCVYFTIGKPVPFKSSSQSVVFGIFSGLKQTSPCDCQCLYWDLTQGPPTCAFATQLRVSTQGHKRIAWVSVSVVTLSASGVCLNRTLCRLCCIGAIRLLEGHCFFGFIFYGHLQPRLT